MDKYGSDEVLETTFGECMDPLDPIGAQEIRESYYLAFPQCPDKLADATFASDFYRYRMYLLDINILLSWGCFSGDGQSCGELGLSYEFEGNEPLDQLVAGIWSDDATMTTIAETRQHNELCEADPTNSECLPEPSFATVFYTNLFGLLSKVVKPELAI